MTVNTQPITYDTLKIQNFPELHLEKFIITNQVNKHAVLHFTGYVENDGSYILTNTVVGSPIKVIYGGAAQEKKTFFAGVITNVRVYKQESNQTIEVTALANTSLLDSVKESRSYQNIHKTYEQIMDEVAGNMGALMTYGADKEEFQNPIGTISIRYKETAWEYLCRLASHKHQGLFGDMSMEKPVFSVGANMGEYDQLKVQAYEYHKDIRNYEVDYANYLPDVLETDYLVYEVETWQILGLGTRVSFGGKKLYIREARYEMKNAVIKATYLLCSANGLKQHRICNGKLQGLSINGITAGVERDKVKVQLEIDKEEQPQYLFPYSTMSASPDGSGWYCMPKEGDQLRVYFPDEEEENCFAISSVSSYTPQPGDSTDRMSDPNVRYLRTPDNKEIKLTPEGITISADDGQAVIMMDNAGNITISGAASVSMTAANDVNISAAHNISLYATESIKLSGQGGEIELDSSGNTTLTGQYVLEN